MTAASINACSLFPLLVRLLKYVVVRSLIWSYVLEALRGDGPEQCFDRSFSSLLFVRVSHFFCERF